MDVIKVKDRDELQKVLDAFEEEDEFDYDELEITDTEAIGEDKIITWGRPYYIEDLGLLVIEGEYCNHDTGNGVDEFIPDWSLTLIYQWDADKTTFGQDDVKGYAYFEQDPPIVALHNYLWAVNKASEDSENL